MTYTMVERAALITLMAVNKEIANVDLKRVYGVNFEKRHRERLQTAGLISVRAQGRRLFYTLTDEGWGWAQSELTAAPPKGAGSAGGALYALLHAFGKALEARDMSLAAFLTPPSGDAKPDPAPTLAAVETPAAPAPVNEAEISEAILAGVVALRDYPDDWIDLKDLRPRLPGDRAAQDAALKALRADKRLDITLRVDQGGLTQADRDAAIRIGVKMMHCVSIRS